MSDFEQKVLADLAEVKSDIKVMKKDLTDDHKALYGNGHPGLIDRVIDLEKENAIAKSRRHWYKDWLGWIVAAATLILEAFHGHF